MLLNSVSLKVEKRYTDQRLRWRDRCVPFLAAYGTATKAGQMPHKAVKDKSP